MMGQDSTRQRGQVVVLFALLVPMLLALGAFVVSIGNWYTHAKNLQTKADASALAGGGVWSFPCVESTTGGPTTSQKIANEARIYAGPHIQANGTPFAATTFNEQVGHVPGSKIHVVLNGSSFYDNDSNQLPTELNDPNNPSICNSKILDVKVTEDDTFPLLSLLPVFPDIKRKARVQIEQVEGLNNLLPIAVRVPEPLSAAAVFYDEGSGTILQAKYMCKERSSNAPAGLGGWGIVDTPDPLNPGLPQNPLCTSPASVNTTNHPNIGVAIALSTRPACDAPGPPAGGWGLCMDDNAAGITTVNDFCHQAGGNVKCFYATGSGATQTVQSGLQFIHSYDGSSTVGNGAPELRSVYFDGAPLGCGNYFSITVDTCTATLHAAIDYGSALDQLLHPGAAADVKYGLVYGNTTRQGDQCMTNQNPPRPNCDMTGSTSASATATFDPRFDNQGNPDGVRHSIALRVRLTKTTIGPPGPQQITCPNSPSAVCEWFFTGNGRTTSIPTLDTIFSAPVQRSFVGDDTISGPIKWTRLAGGSCGALLLDGEAASQSFGPRCFDFEIGLKGALATDQDEPPFVFNFKGSQSGAVDCDDGYPNWKTEVLNNCRPFYSANDFSRTPTTNPTGPCPWPVGTPVSWNTFMNPPAPYNVEWPSYTCVRSDGPPAPGQVNQGLNERLFPGVNGNNVPCPQDSSTEFVGGRNYWDDSNNASGGTYAFADLGVHPNNLKSQTDDRRLVTLFLTTYDSFTGNGGSTWPIVGFANFYITGWGKATGRNGLQIQDPCPGNDPPPDLVINSGLSGAEFVWGHFVNAVTPDPFTTGGNGVLCKPEQFQPCVAVLVE